KNAASYTAQVLSARLKRNISVNLRDALFRQLQRADLDVFDKSPAGELANVFLVETFRTTMATEACVGLVQRMSIAAFYVAALFFLSWPLTLIVVALGLALGSALAFVYRRLTRAGAELTETNHRMAAALGQTFAGIRVVRVTNSQQREVHEFHAVNAAQARAEESSARAASLLFPLTETLAVAGAMVVVTCAYVFFVRPGHMLSSYLLAYGFVLLRLLPLLNQLYGLQGHLLYLAGGSREVQSWLDRPVYPQRPFGATEFAGVQREIRFDAVSYEYPNGHRALVDVSFAVGRGETVAVVGRSGSGKSTLAALLLRLRAPASGRIFVDGRDYWEFSPESWHRATALVEQDAFLFHGTLRENIVYGSPHAGEPELRRALAIANLEDVVLDLPQGLDTIVGERGAMLSGGQRQRIAIARAVVRNPSILILDEATSHLDVVSERLVQQALHRAAAGRTTLVIAHRLATIREADRIVVLDQGRVVEEGTWEALQSRGGVFEQLLTTMSIRDRIA
ncbi:MAG TPA: ABC transporter ATP-binding protein, partial [Vicinamibacterales bacterium]|nr:ABC transporter ATP-binding protein [Vicinamibacterales bacterium]